MDEDCLMLYTNRCARTRIIKQHRFQYQPPMRVRNSIPPPDALGLPFKLIIDQFKKYKATTAELGHLNAFLYSANRAYTKTTGRHILWRYVLVAQPVPSKDRLSVSRGRTIEVRPLNPGDPTLTLLPITVQTIEHRLRQGAICLGAFKNDEIIGCIWLQFGAFDEDEVRCRFVPLPADETAWDFDVYVAPLHRGSLAFLRLWDSANAYLRARGIRWSMSRISAFNKISLTSHARMNACRLGTATYLRLGGCQIMISSLKPFLHLSMRPASKPSVDLHAPTPHG